MLQAALLLMLTTAPAAELAPADEAVPASPERPPAVGETDATVFNTRSGEQFPVTRAHHKIGTGLSVASKDGRFSLQLRGRIQVRYDLEHPHAAGEDVKQLLQIRRMRLLLQGNAFSPYVKYYFQFGFSARDMANDLPNETGSIRRNPVRDARIELDRLRDFNVWLGQAKVPFSRQRRVSSSNLGMVDRSLVNAEFNLDRDLGVHFLSRDLGGLGGRLAYYAGVFMGEGRNAYDYTDPGMLFVGRLEFLPFGAFDDYSEGDLTRSRTPGLSIAGAYAFQDRAHAARGVVGDYPADRGTTNFHHITTDLMFKWRGLSVTTALHLRKGFKRVNGGALDDTGAPIPTVPARQGLGWYGQLGYVVPKIPIEIVARYGLIRNTYGHERSSLTATDEAGGGINWYILGHSLKVQLDYFRVWKESMGQTDQIRLQAQLYF